MRACHALLWLSAELGRVKASGCEERRGDPVDLLVEPVGGDRLVARVARAVIYAIRLSLQLQGG